VLSLLANTSLFVCVVFPAVPCDALSKAVCVDSLLGFLCTVHALWGQTCQFFCQALLLCDVLPAGVYQGEQVNAFVWIDTVPPS
jgi:hypothetical protein